jgi:hypothetical protein
MKQTLLFVFALLGALTLGLEPAYGQERLAAQKSVRKKLQPFFTVGPNLPVVGGGTHGQLTMWVGANGTNSILGDSIITQTKPGLVGIGTTEPTSTLTVHGTIESTLGGFKFPDGSIQTSAGVSTSQAVTSLNNLTGNVTLVPGANIAITPTGNSLQIGASGLLGGVAHDSTLAGDGTSGAPLGLAVPLMFTGSVTGTQRGPGLLNVTNNGFDGIAIEGVGGTQFGTGIEATGFDAVVGIATSLGGSFAGSFEGDVSVDGNPNVKDNLNVKGTKNFKIDHPLDPENKYLYHAAIESAEVLNIYSGNITTDETGQAVVYLPDWLQVINRDFRYQLTVIGSFAQAIVASEISNNRFTIKTSAPGVKVSWQVTGVRSDPAILKHPFRLEEDKPAYERGYYLNPEAYGQPAERGIEWAHNPVLMHLRHRETRGNEAEVSGPIRADQ